LGIILRILSDELVEEMVVRRTARMSTEQREKHIPYVSYSFVLTRIKRNPPRLEHLVG
jgi:hypothetical protein